MSRYSIIPAQAIFDPRLSPRDITVLCAIGMHTDKAGWCFPSQSTLGQILGISRPMINGVIKHLQNCGYLQVVQKFNGHAQTVNLMRILMDRIVEPEYQRQLTPPVSPGVTPPVNSGVTPPVSPEVTQTSHLNDPSNVKDMGEQARPSPLPDAEKNRDSKKVSRIPNGSSDSGFQRLRSLYPKRDGDQRWAEAEQHYRARLKEGVSRETIEDGVMRYAKYCKVKGIEGKEFVQQAATFLGRNRGYASEWTLPAEPVSPFA